MLAAVLAVLAFHAPACAEDSWCWNALVQGNHRGRWYMTLS